MMMMMMMMRPNAFIHSFIRERERERKRGKSLVSRRGLSSPHANENKKETKRGARFFVVVVVVVVDAKTLVVVVLLKRQKRESVWSQRHKETHFFHHLMGFERWLFHKIPLYTSPTKKQSLFAFIIYLRFRHRRRTPPRLRKAIVFFSFFLVESRRHFVNGEF